MAFALFCTKIKKNRNLLQSPLARPITKSSTTTTRSTTAGGLASTTTTTTTTKRPLSSSTLTSRTTTLAANKKLSPIKKTTTTTTTLTRTTQSKSPKAPGVTNGIEKKSVTRTVTTAPIIIGDGIGGATNGTTIDDVIQQMNGVHIGNGETISTITTTFTANKELIEPLGNGDNNPIIDLSAD